MDDLVFPLPLDDGVNRCIAATARQKGRVDPVDGQTPIDPIDGCFFFVIINKHNTLSVVNQNYKYKHFPKYL